MAAAASCGTPLRYLILRCSAAWCRTPGCRRPRAPRRRWRRAAQRLFSGSSSRWRDSWPGGHGPAKPSRTRLCTRPGLPLPVVVVRLDHQISAVVAHRRGQPVSGADPADGPLVRAVPVARHLVLGERGGERRPRLRLLVTGGYVTGCHRGLVSPGQGGSGPWRRSRRMVAARDFCRAAARASSVVPQVGGQAEEERLADRGPAAGAVTGSTLNRPRMMRAGGLTGLGHAAIRRALARATARARPGRRGRGWRAGGGRGTACLSTAT